MKRDGFEYIFNRYDRSLFIDNEYKKWARLNEPLSIGYGQTISQPSLVFKMTQQLEMDKKGKVLEIGTGSGYQTELLAECAGTVYTVEIIPELSLRANERLSSLGYDNIYYRIGDGSKGCDEYAPYDRTITTAAEKMPQRLIEQLKPGGIAITPVGQKGYQDLFRITKDDSGNIKSESLGKVTFVELKGQYGWTDNKQ